MLFGGSQLGDFYGNATKWFNDTWEFHNGSWSAIHAVGWTPRRSAGTMTFFPRVQKVVMFGGEVLSASGVESESRSLVMLNNGTWGLVRSSGMPLQHGIYTIMLFLPRTAELFYEIGSGGIHNDWVYSNHTWSYLSPRKSLPLQDSYSMAYDGRDGYVLLFGGYASNNAPTNLSWGFWGNSWHRI